VIALDNIIEQMREAIRGEADGTTIPVPVEDIRALIAEHERVLAERAAPHWWEYGVRHFDTYGFPTDRRHLSREHAERDLATCGMNCYLVRRGMTNPGPWEPLPEDTNQPEGEHHA
jgi:hypothetical protein